MAKHSSNAAAVAPRDDMVKLPGGTFRMGSDHHYPDEAPAHTVGVDGFWIDRYTVTNAEFARFVDQTAYVTFAERPANADDYPGADPSKLVPSSIVFRQPTRLVDLRDHCNWWAYVPGASWRHPEGPGSSIDDRMDHPVVHVAYEDVEAYAAWIGKQVPTEAEWEYAARGGLDGAEYVWGGELQPDGVIMANTWQGEFPVEDRGLRTHGFTGTAPVGSFPPNRFGLHDMAGNVWEWTCDWYEAGHRLALGCCSAVRNPRGGRREHSIEQESPGAIPRKVMKGGSYLCAPNYCRRYRPAARMAQPIDTSTCHLGIRLILR